MYHSLISLMPKATPLLLDAYPGAYTAFSTRKLRSPYSSDCIIVRRTDSTQQNIGFTSNVLDTATLSSFVGTGALDNGFIPTWYDQVLSFNLLQPAGLNQTKIVTAGVIETINSKPAINFSSNTGVGTAANLTLNDTTQLWFFYTVDLTDVTTSGVFMETSVDFNNNTGALNFGIGSGLLSFNQKVSFTLYCRVTIPITIGKKIIAVRFRSGQTAANAWQIWVNGVAQITTVTNNNISIATTNHRLFMSRAGNSLTALNKRAELVIYKGDQSSNRAGIESNINSFYTIY
jgi:hypothetical protein